MNNNGHNIQMLRMASGSRAHPARVVMVHTSITVRRANALCPTVTDFIFAGHCSEEAGHRYMLDYLKLEPILDLGMRLGEGTGGALSMSIMEGAVSIFKEVLTFAEAGVADKE